MPGPVTDVVVFVVGVATGGLVVWMVLRARAAAAAALAAADADARLRTVEADARERVARLDAALAAERSASAARIAALQDAEVRLSASFQALSAQALQRSADQFLQLAAARFETLRTAASGEFATRQAEITGVVSPLREALQKVERTLAEVEQARREERGSLGQRLEGMALAQQGLQDETARLVRALQAPHVRGRWGELQLRRVVELAGLDEHCDFRAQVSLEADDGVLRPDLVVTLPGGRTVVVDAKAPMTAYLEAINIADESARVAKFRDHAAQVRAHVTALGAKAYWARCASTPDFVVLFLPGESFFSAAIQHDPSLFEYGVSQRVFVAGPFTLLALLRTVAHGWSSERLAENARHISTQAKELYDRLAGMTEHLADLRRRLAGAVEAHNQAIGSLESRVLPAARRMKELGVQPSRDLVELRPIEQTARRVQAADLVAPPASPAVDAELIADAVGALEPRLDD